ncbi:porin [Methylobacterium sp. 4-46]|uniref:outer membrane protein n=1 Tax=unclassified Methylobacterium TaxID=2615210 RepID=UPI000152E32C|nr:MULTISPECIES: outer membrane beta-barrel protein [Methylobacterium]ACA17474.1 porin [Methylobacterium sp. 4-46]WFT83158.1 outer membrane beta-barrel protein [Methylobacterium nodulans]
MRIVTSTLLAGLCVCGLTPARAADLDFATLRGTSYDAPAPAGNWDGFYFGGHGGWTSTSFGFGSVFQAPVANYLRQTKFESDLNASTLLHPGSMRRDSTTFGAYVGINFQLDEFVAGAELDYTHLSARGWTSDEIGRAIVGSDGWWRAVYLTGNASTRIDDYATLRARFGYDAGNFMPFVTGGFAIGRAQISETIGVQPIEYDQATYKSNQSAARPAYVNYSGYSNFDQTNPGASTPSAPHLLVRSREKIVGGIAAGAGMEFAMTANILLRAEYQFVQFNDFDGHKANINTVRGGAALKF